MLPLRDFASHGWLLFPCLSTTFFGISLGNQRLHCLHLEDLDVNFHLFLHGGHGGHCSEMPLKLYVFDLPRPTHLKPPNHAAHACNPMNQYMDPIAQNAEIPAALYIQPSSSWPIATLRLG